jgi:hypothetical protein
VLIGAIRLFDHVGWNRLFCFFVHHAFSERLLDKSTSTSDFSQIFFPRSLTQELGYTTTLIHPPIVNKSQITVPDGRHVSPKHVPVTIVRSASAHTSEFSQGDDTTPEYEPEDSANITHAHSCDGHTRMRRQAREQIQDEEAPPADGQYIDTPYMFDRHSGCLVRSHSDGLAIGLHPYVRDLIVCNQNVLCSVTGPNIPIANR